MIHSALCVWKSALKPKSFASIPEYLDRVHKCPLFAPCFMPFSLEAGNVYIVDPVDLALNTWCPLSDDFAFTIDALSNEFSSISDKQTSRLGRWGTVRLAFSHLMLTEKPMALRMPWKLSKGFPTKDFQASIARL